MSWQMQGIESDPLHSALEVVRGNFWSSEKCWSVEVIGETRSGRSSNTRSRMIQSIDEVYYSSDFDYALPDY